MRMLCELVSVIVLPTCALAVRIACGFSCGLNSMLSMLEETISNIRVAVHSHWDKSRFCGKL